MGKRTWLWGVAAAMGMSTAAWAQATRPAEVPVRAVVLFSSGVGYFEHFGKVTGDNATELRFKTNQINDILKSLVLEDLDKGQIASVSYPSQDPIAKTLKSFQVDISGYPSMAELLNQLRGAKVQITANGQEYGGLVLGVEKRQQASEKDKPPVEVAVLNLLSGGTMQQFEIARIGSITLEDAQLQEELNKALAALGQARDQDKKPVVINFRGQGERRVRLGYVVETPVWKTSYRLVLSPAGEKPGGKLQGWAIVENQTDNDWNNVQLSLVSGRPISFVQDLYQPLYLPRPIVKPELYSLLRPQTYEGGMAGGDASAPAPANAPMAAGKERLERSSGRKLMETRGEAAGKTNMAFELGINIDPMSSVQAATSAAKLGELFQYTVQTPVSLPRQRSAMIPIISDAVEVERLSIYNAGVLPRNPLNGARLKNSTDKHLLQGPITVFEAATYAGDARIDDVPAGQERLISYGVDLQVLVDSTKNKSDSAIQTGKIVKGILHLTRKQVFQQEYTAENKADKDKTLVIEHVLRPGWKLVDSPKPFETTPALYRFRHAVPTGKSATLTVKEELIHGETLAILPADIGQIEFYSRAGEIPPAVRSALATVLQSKRQLVETQRQIEEKQKELANITQGQERIRRNMQSVPQNSAYYNRLLKQLDDEETRINALQGEVKSLQDKANSQQAELERNLEGLSVG